MRESPHVIVRDGDCGEEVYEWLAHICAPVSLEIVESNPRGVTFGAGVEVCEPITAIVACLGEDGNLLSGKS